MSTRAMLCALCVLFLAGPAPTADQAPQPNPIAALLDEYASRRYTAVSRQLATTTDVAAFTKDLQRYGLAWTEAGGSNEVRHRRLVAATVALEAAAFHFWPEDVDPLIEWGCQLLRKDKPDEPEHLWQLASVAIFGRARDDGKLVTVAGPGAPVGSLKKPAPRPVDHITHALLRFPDEPRFRLAEAMLAATAADTEPARDADWLSPAQLPRNSDEAVRRARAERAIQMFNALSDVPELRVEADVRMGYLYFTLHDPKSALEHFAAARDATDPFIAYLARFLAGRTLDAQGDHSAANDSYRSALDVIPHALSASEAIAANDFLSGRADEAYAVTEDALSARPSPEDPWQSFGYGDLRLIPGLMNRLREGIR